MHLFLPKNILVVVEAAGPSDTVDRQGADSPDHRRDLGREVSQHV